MPGLGRQERERERVWEEKEKMVNDESRKVCVCLIMAKRMYRVE